MEENLDIWVKISQQIGELNASIKNVLDNISNHEGRILRLERNSNERHENWKNDLLMLLAKAVVVGSVAVATLVGGGSVLAKIFGV